MGQSRKDKYVSKAIDILKQEGFLLSLDEMAARMGVTKKTLYNNFSSKEELLKECVHAISSDFQSAISLLDDGERSAIESLVLCFKQLDRLFETLNPVFFSDLMRNNPHQAMLEHAIGSNFFGDKMQANLRRGVETGLYRADLDIPFMCEYLSYSVFGFYINAVVRNKLLPSGSYFATILGYHLRAIVSEEGNQLLYTTYHDIIQ